MRNPALLLAVAVAVLLAAGWLSATYAERRRRGMQTRLASVLVAAPNRVAQSPAGVSLRRVRASGGIGGWGFAPGRLYGWLLEELGATGDKLTVSSLVVAALIGAVVAGALVGVVLPVAAEFAVPVVLVAGLAAAGARLHFAKERFRQRFVELFPDALDVIIRAVRAGLPVLDSIEAAVGNVGEPVAGEFRRLLDELRIGIELDEALERAANRIRVNDFRFFAATLILQRRTGGSLAETLTNLAGLIRRRREVRLKARALTAESRATAYLLGILPFLMMGAMYLLNRPLVATLFTDPRGNIILGIAMVMLVMGFVVMSFMIKKALR